MKRNQQDAHNAHGVHAGKDARGAAQIEVAQRDGARAIPLPNEQVGDQITADGEENIDTKATEYGPPSNPCVRRTPPGTRAHATHRATVFDLVANCRAAADWNQSRVLLPKHGRVQVPYNGRMIGSMAVLTRSVYAAKQLYHVKLALSVLIVIGGATAWSSSNQVYDGEASSLRQKVRHFNLTTNR